MLDSHLARKFLIFFVTLTQSWLKACLHTFWLEHSHVRPTLYQDKKRKFGEAKVTKS
jgi:hypothetical protein